MDLGSQIPMQSTPDNSNLQGKYEKVAVMGSSKQIARNGVDSECK